MQKNKKKNKDEDEDEDEDESSDEYYNEDDTNIRSHSNMISEYNI